MGGAKHIAKRMQLTASSAAQIFGFFQEIRNPIDLSLKAWVAAIKHRELSKYDLADHFVDKVLPLRGTLDEESCRMSMDKALIDLIEDNPNIDLFQLSDVDIWRVVTSFVRYEANERLNLDIGKKFEELSITPMEIVERQSEMSDYLMAELDAQIIRERNTENNQAGMRIDQMITRAVENTFMVFEEMLT